MMRRVSVRGGPATTITNLPGDLLALAPPGLDVAATLGHARQIERRAADQRDRFRLTLPHVPGCDLAVGLVALGGAPSLRMGR